MAPKQKSKKPTKKKKSAFRLINDVLKLKSATKNQIYDSTLESFQEFKAELEVFANDLRRSLDKTNKGQRIPVKYASKGEFEGEVRFAGDVLYFMMHSNIFNFDDDHKMYKTKYIKDDDLRTYCGVIQVFNFLSDSIKYNRSNDVGYLIARIFVNKEKHFFVEGKRQLGFLYNEFEKNKITKTNIRKIIESAVLYTLDFDLLTPPYDEVSQVTLQEKIAETGSSKIKTGKRVGFRFQADSDHLG
ncbi:MAG: hypothetical protein COC01_01735 [Bacteroidetes bacterium]|nr:hypothetical protein [Bacteroidia bacterium]PCH69356.1 MAG: hypothetical protein COC01_01735 [Bacteroidota bacterium]